MPKKYQDLVPHLCVNNAAAAIDFYKNALGAQELVRHAGPDGKKIMHSEIRIGDSVFMLVDEFPEMGGALRSPTTLGGCACSFQVSVPDCDASFKRATDSGGKALMPPADMFWGDRYAMIQDPFGHVWAFRTQKEEVSPEELDRRTKAFFAGQK
jgi:PhnB protein